MKTKLLTSIAILIFMVSCREIETQRAQILKKKPITDLKTEAKKNNNHILEPEQYFVNNSLLMLLISDLEIIALNPMFELKTQPKINIHNTTIIDTIKIRTFQKTKIHTYRAVHKEWIYAANIRDSEFEFLKSIKIGASKKVLENILNSDLETNLIKIGDLEGNSVFTFKFENNIIKSIDFESYID